MKRATLKWEHSNQSLLSVVVGGAWLTGTILLLPVAALAQNDDTEEFHGQKLTVEAFLVKVLGANPQMNLLESQVKLARAEVELAKTRENPTVSAEREEVFADGNREPEHLVRIDVPIPLSKERQLKLESAQKGIAATAAGVKAKKHALLGECLKLYYEAAAYLEKLQRLSASKQELELLAQTVRKRADAGDASGLDMSRIDAELLALDDELTDVRLLYRRHQLILGYLAGLSDATVSPRTSLMITDDNNIVTAATPAASGSNDTDSQSAQAVSFHIQSLTLQVEQALLAQKAAEKKKAPMLVLSGGFKTATSQNDTAMGYLAGLSLSLPLFYSGEGERAKAAAELVAAKDELEVANKQLRSRRHVAKEMFQQNLLALQTFETGHLEKLEALKQQMMRTWTAGEVGVFEPDAVLAVPLLEGEVPPEAPRRVVIMEDLGPGQGAEAHELDEVGPHGQEEVHVDPIRLGKRVRGMVVVVPTRHGHHRATELDQQLGRVLADVSEALHRGADTRNR